MYNKCLLVTYFVALFCGLAPGGAANQITTLTVGSDYNGDTSGEVRKNQPFKITTDIEFNLNSGNYSVEVQLSKPSSSAEVCGETFWDDTTVNETCTPEVSSSATWTDPLPIVMNAANSSYSNCYYLDSDEVHVYCQFEYFGGAFPAETIEIILEATLDTFGTFTFDVVASIYEHSNYTLLDNNTDSVNVTVGGALLRTAVAVSDNGNEAVYNFTIQHRSQSTQNATNMTITPSFPRNSAYPITSANYSVNSGPTDDVLGNSSYSPTTFDVGDSISLIYTRDIGSSSVQLGVLVPISLRIEWEDAATPEVGYDEMFAGYFYRDVDFTDPNAQDIPTELFSAKSFTVERTFSMPTGIMNDVELVVEFTDGDMDTILMTVNSATLTPPNSGSFSVDSIYTSQEGGSAQWTVARKKRSTGSSPSREKRAAGEWTLTVPFGTVENTDNVNLDFTVAVALTVGTLPESGNANGLIYLQYNGVAALLYYGEVYFAVPWLTITKVAALIDDSVRPNILHFNVTVEHDSSLSTSDAFGVALTDGASYLDINFQEDFVPGVGGDVSVSDDTYITYTQDPFSLADIMVLSYKASSNVDFPEEDNVYYTARVKWYPSAEKLPDSVAQVEASACLKREEILIENVLYQHGFTVLALICGILAGALIGVLIVFIIWICRRKMKCLGGVGPMFGGVKSSKRGGMMKTSNTDSGLVTSVSDTMKRGYANIRDLSKTAANDSIVFMLALKDKLKQNREMDNMDIMATINVDEEIEKERNGAMIKATHALVAGLRITGDITKGTEDKCSSKFQKNIGNLEKNLNNEYKKEMEDIFKRMSLKNKAKLAEMQERQKLERMELEGKLRESGMSESEKKELRELQQKEHQVEQEDVNYRLKLEQDEEAEKLRKEYSVRKRMGIKTLQQEHLDSVIKEGKLENQEQIDWLMKEHYKNQSTLESMYDDEISRQRMLLEEKLARRRALAHKTELQEEAHSDVLNTIASQHLDTIKKTKKGGNLSPTEAKQMMTEAQENMKEIKEKMDADRERQEKNLHERLSQRKKEKMAELAKRQQQEANDMDKKINSALQSEGVDPIAAVQSKQQLLSNQRAEKSELENELDREHAKELEKLREDIAQKMREDLQENKDKDMQELTQYGLSDKEMNKLLKKHEKELETLGAQQAEDRASQEANFKAKLAAQRKDWARRKEQERNEQQTLREHEENVVQRLMDNQVAMSEDERNNIMQEHEKQMVKMENSLTLNKLSQKRMLEEKLSKKRAQQMEKLEKKQLTETKKNRNGAEFDSDDEDTNAELDLMKKHAEQRIAVMQGEKISLDDELDEIREAMTKERAAALQEQEVKIAAMLADLQMAKAKEMAKIEEQQKAIFNLKANLMDDLNEKGVLSDPECQKVIKIHQEEQEKLNQKLDSQKSKQEQILRRKLEERLKAKEAQMSRMQESEIRDRMGAAANTPAGKIRRAALLSKHMIEVEKFRNRMDKEVNQTLEELRRQNDIRRMNLIQEQELQFINGLVRLGKFDKNELENVVAMLFPTKKEEERRTMLNKLMEGYQAPAAAQGKGGKQQPPQAKGLSRRTSTLEQRVKSASIAKGESASLQGSFRGKKKGKKGRALEQRYDEDFGDTSYSYGNQRPEPIGRSYTPDHFGDQYDRDFDTAAYGSQRVGGGIGGGMGRMPQSRLPPLEGSLGPVTKKKKKKTRTEPIDEDF